MTVRSSTLPAGISVGAALVYALVLVASMVQTAAVPLLPRYAEAFGLAPAQTGALLAAPAVMMLHVAAPSGLIGDQLGARRVLLIGAGLTTASTLGQALAGSFAALLASRAVLGAALAAVWAAGPAWLAQTAGQRGEARVGATMTCSAVGVVLGPAMTGVLAQRAGLGAPFWIAGAAATVLSVLLLASPSGSAPGAATGGPSSLRGLVRSVSAQPEVRAGAVGVVLIGMVSSVVQLSAPLALDARGVSTETIGLAFSASAVVYLASSTCVLALGARAVTLSVLALAALGCALALSPAALSASGAGVVVAVVLFAAPRATLSTVAYPLATREGSRAGLGESGVLGMLNTSWAAATVAGPLAAGALGAALGTQTVFALTLAVAVLMAAWLGRPANAARGA